MGETLRDVDLAMIKVRQFKGLPAAVSGRISSEIDDNIPDCALEAAHEFDFAVWVTLIVHASDGAPA